MQIKVFKAGNMKDAMAAMKAELGDDAVILHSKKYKEGGLLGIGSREVVEITAAVEENSLPKKNEPLRLKHPTVANSIRNEELGISNENLPPVEEEKISPPVEEEKISPPVEEEKISPPAEEEKISPPAEEEKISPPVEEEKISPPVEEEKISPPAEEEKISPPAEEEKISPPVEEEKISPPVEEEKISPPVEEEKISPPVEEEKISPPVEEEKISPLVEEEKISPSAEKLPPQSNAVTQEQLAQTQAMIMAQFNQMQMMQQAAIAQAQAQAQEQMRLQQVQQPAPPTQNEEKIQRLEEEIAQMKALLAEVLGRGSNKNMISLHEALKSQEVEEDILNEMAAQSGAGETLVDFRSPTARSTLTKYLTEHVRFSDGIKLNRHGVRIVALLGTTGVGKTTTLAKIAAKFVLEQRTNAALITADTYRISAVEQLKTYSDILELPLEIVYNPQELASAIERHRDRELILIDTAGRSQHNDYQLRELEEFLRVNPRIEKHLVISATTKFTDARQILNKFSKVEPDRIIFTKVDETGSLGMIVNLLRDKKFALSYITTGQSVPDDIERAGVDVLTNFLFRKIDEQ